LQIRLGAHTVEFPHQRIASATLVAALHACIVTLLLEMTFATLERPAQPETFVAIMPAPLLTHAVAGARRGPDTRAITAPVWTVPPVLQQPNVPAIGDMLFDCRPEKLELLSDEQRARCKLALGGPAGNRWTAFQPAPTESQYAELWQQAIKDRETPVQVPCAVVSGQSVAMKTPDGRPMSGPPVKTKPGIGVSYVCLALTLWHALNR